MECMSFAACGTQEPKQEGGDTKTGNQEQSKDTEKKEEAKETKQVKEIKDLVIPRVSTREIETFNILYSQMAKDADEEGFHELAEQFRGVAAIEKAHEERYLKLLKNVEMQQVFEKSGECMWECRICGHLVVGKKAPEVCPVCGYSQAYFEVRATNY